MAQSPVADGGASQLAQAEAAFQRRAFEEAARLARQVTHETPANLQGWRLLSESLEQLGRTSEAIVVLGQAVAQNPRAPALHNRLAALSHKAGDPAGAETHLRKAVEIDPAYAPAWNNLAKVLAQNGKLIDAETALRNAVAAAPGHPLHLLELARFVLAVGRIAEAEALMSRAEALAGAPAFASQQPADAAAFANLRSEMLLRMADAYLKTAQVPQAVAYLEQAVALGAGPAIQDQFISLLLRVTFSKPRPSLKPILLRSLDEHWTDATQIGRFAAHLLLLEADFQALHARDVGQAPDLDSPAARQALADPLLLALLSRALVVDPALERFLTGLRRAALDRVADPARAPGKIDPALLPFFAALANQCFANEYAFAVSDEEAAAAAALADRCRSRLAQGERPGPLEIAVVAAYAPLHDLFDGNRTLLSGWPPWLDAVIARQVSEPLEEAALKTGIPAATAIDDPGSRAVQAQYEDNPFPRWVSPSRRVEKQALAAWARRNFPGAPDIKPPRPGQRRQGLIAGCGTGQETAALSATFSDVDWFAIDLSLASLAHAARKSGELGLGNVTFACADLLELRSLDRTFDFVVSAGVLHHLDKPADGLQTLRDITRPGGLLLIALYSAAARRHLEAARAFAKDGGYGVSAQELRRYRADVLALPSPSPAWRDDLLNRDDFYSLSMLRDLVFHVRETGFDIDRIEAMLAALDLRFCGFSASADVVHSFQARFGAAADLTSLAQWRTFEAENPDTFWHMYHFLVQRG